MYTNMHTHVHLNALSTNGGSVTFPFAECASLPQALRHLKMHHKLPLSLFLSFFFSLTHTCTEESHNRIFSWKWEQAAQEQEA